MVKSKRLEQDTQCLELFKQLIENQDIQNIARQLYYSGVYPPDWFSTKNGQKEQDEYNKRSINQIPTSLRDEIKDFIYNDLITPIQSYMSPYQWGEEFPHSWSDWIIRQL